MSEDLPGQDLGALLAPYRAVEVDERAVAAVARTARVPRARRALLVAAVAVGALGALAAAPATRTALTGAGSVLMDGLRGEPSRGDVIAAPGGVRLNYLEDVAPGSSRVLAQRGALRLVAFRNVRTSHVCLSFGAALTECRPGEEWALSLSDRRVAPQHVVPGQGRAVLWGLVGDGVARMVVRYRDGGVASVTVGAGGFVAVVDPAHEPVTLEVTDADGELLERVPLDDFIWVACTDPAGCAPEAETR